MERHLVYNAMVTPDGTLLESLYGHDYKTYTDKNGVFYMIDGGLNYTRYSGDGQQKWITYYDDDPFELVRQHFHWGRNYDKDMKRLLTTEWIKLCEITDDHLLALLDYPGIPTWCVTLFENELKFREGYYE